MDKLSIIEYFPLEIILLILEKIYDGESFSNLTLTCTYFRNIIFKLLNKKIKFNNEYIYISIFYKAQNYGVNGCYDVTKQELKYKEYIKNSIENSIKNIYCIKFSSEPKIKLMYYPLTHYKYYNFSIETIEPKIRLELNIITEKMFIRPINDYINTDDSKLKNKNDKLLKKIRNKKNKEKYTKSQHNVNKMKRKTKISYHGR